MNEVPFTYCEAVKFQRVLISSQQSQLISFISMRGYVTVCSGNQLIPPPLPDSSINIIYYTNTHFKDRNLFHNAKLPEIFFKISSKSIY